MGNQSFEERVDAPGRKVDAGFRDWVKNDQIFNGLRNTPARILLAVLTIGVLYGIPVIELVSGGVPILLYIGLLGLVILMQKLSVRFAFDDDSEIDEYQHKRRNRAYRRAYKRVGLNALLVVALLAWNSSLNFNFASRNPNIIFIFVVGLFVLQKYLSWGIKGEPWSDTAREKVDKYMAGN